jgi:dienelactone hydrolase
MFPSANVIRTNEAFGQAVSDLRALRAWLEQRGSVVGVMGMSLGGYTTALWASVDPKLAYAVPWIPAVDMADLMWRHGEESRPRRPRHAARSGRAAVAALGRVRDPLVPGRAPGADRPRRRAARGAAPPGHARLAW